MIPKGGIVMTDYLLYALIAVVIISVALEIRIIFYNMYISKYFSSSKFNIQSELETDIKSNKSIYTISVYNNNVNDARILAFGFIYKNEFINFFNAYLDSKKIEKEDKLIISSRDFIRYDFGMVELENMVKAINKNNQKVDVIYGFVNDGSGNITRVKAKVVRKNIKKHFADEIRAGKIAEKKTKDAYRHIESARRAKHWAEFLTKIGLKRKTPDEPITDEMIATEIVRKEDEVNARAAFVAEKKEKELAEIKARRIQTEQEAKLKKEKEEAELKAKKKELEEAKVLTAEEKIEAEAISEAETVEKIHAEQIAAQKPEENAAPDDKISTYEAHNNNVEELNGNNANRSEQTK